MTVDFRELAPGDIQRIARDMRQIDRIECAAAGLTPKLALRMAVKSSLILWTGTVDGKAEAMFGVRPKSMLDGVGAPWLLGTDKARSCVREWIATAPLYVAAMHELFPLLENVVHRDNASAIRWLTHLGFAVEPELVHIGGEPMRRFHKGETIHVPPSDRSGGPSLRGALVFRGDGGADHRRDGRDPPGAVPIG